MFRALTSVSKQEVDATKANPPPRKQAWQPASDGARAQGMPPAHPQHAYGNQAVLRIPERSRPAGHPAQARGQRAGQCL